MGLLRTIAFILLGYVVLSFLSRWLAPKLFGYAARKAEDRLREMYGMPQDRFGEKEQPEGKVTVDKKSNKNGNDSDKVGEYIEFEEID